MTFEKGRGAASSEEGISVFWKANPCGDWQVGGLADRFGDDYERFFTEYDGFRYRREGHIPGCLDGISFVGKEVLEIGWGQGTESEQIIRRGGCWSGLDLTQGSVAGVRERMRQPESPVRRPPRRLGAADSPPR